MKKINNLILFFILSSIISFAQDAKYSDSPLLGYWEGAFIRNNSYQKIDIQFTEKDGQLYGLQIMDEWHPTFGEFEVPVKIDPTGFIKFGTGYGKAKLTLDKNNLELTGQIQDFNPSIYLHLKKGAQRPSPAYTLEEVAINSDNNQIYGHLHIPNQREHTTAVIIVGGRGCNADATKYNLYAKFLRKYGISVLAYQKRGTGKSTGDCTTATIQDLALDLQEVKKYLESHSNNYQNIGVLGISAGGWTMTNAEENIDFNFMISVVGPATSVKDQQLQSMEYGARFYNLEEAARQNLRAYTNLMFEAKANQRDFDKMNKLLLLAEREQWKQLLDDTDIPKEVSEINNLWVRRHNYDPEKSLSNFEKPFLAIYGERDWIVPFDENINVLEDYFLTRKNNLNTVVAYNAEHGMEMEAKWINLNNNHTYWHFYRISPEVRIEIVKFLRKYNLIK